MVKWPGKSSGYGSVSEDATEVGVHDEELGTCAAVAVVADSKGLQMAEWQELYWTTPWDQRHRPHHPQHKLESAVPELLEPVAVADHPDLCATWSPAVAHQAAKDPQDECNHAENQAA